MTQMQGAVTGQSATSSAPGKIILFGEHAVVYGRPAIAAPVHEVRACATVQPAPHGSGFRIEAVDIGRSFLLEAAPVDDPLAAAVRLTLAHLGVPPPDAVCTLTSTIPIASGMGSGAATAAALCRAVAAYLGRTLDAAALSALVYEVEKLHHGTPSGIDNAVVSYDRPIFYVRDHPPVHLSVGAPLYIVIADTGVRSLTKTVVAHVRRGWERDPARYDALFDQIGDLVMEARRLIEDGRVQELGMLMDENHALLAALGVSSPALDALTEAARLAGALGAKLSGAGRGGNVIALVEEDMIDEVVRALEEAGAARTIRTVVERERDGI